MTPSDAELVAVVAGIVAAARKQFSKIDGWLVYILALVASLAVCWYVDAPLGLRTVAVRAIRITIGAVGGVSLASYLVGKLGSAVKPKELPAKDTKNAVTEPAPAAPLET